MNKAVALKNLEQAERVYNKASDMAEEASAKREDALTKVRMATANWDDAPDGRQKRSAQSKKLRAEMAFKNACRVAEKMQKKKQDSRAKLRTATLNWKNAS